MEKTLSDGEACTIGFRENQGIFLVAGALYRTSALSWIHFGCFTVGVISLLSCLCRTAFLLTDDLTTLFETLHWIAILMTVLSAIPSSFPNMDRYNQVFTRFGRDLFAYVGASEDDTTKEISALRDKGLREKHLLVRLFSVLLLSTFCGFSVLLPAYSIYTGKFFEPQRNDGIITGIPCVIWIPVRIAPNNIVIVRIVLMFIQGYISGTVINMVIAQQGSAICIGHKLLYEFQVLALSMKQFSKRALQLHKRQQGIGNCRVTMNQYVRKCFEEGVLHHRILVSIAENYSDIFFIHELALLSSSTLLICLSAISLVSDVPVASKIVSLIFTGAELSNVFVGCFYGQVLLDSHQIVASALYDSEWTQYSMLIGKHVSIMQARLQRPLSLTAGGFADVNLDMYAQVVKSSFSYFSLLQALKE